MVELQDLTVGQVSGMIAAAVFLVQILLPIALPVILIGLLRLRSPAVTETAVSWSVISRFLHTSLWPVFLGTDSAATLSANRSTLFMSAFRIFMLALVAVAAIVTPLGLHEGIVGQAEPTSQKFHYIEDPSTFGLGTPSRTVASGTWSRICGYSSPYVCPNSPNKLSDIKNSTGTYIQADTWYDSKIPKKVIDVFESGLVYFEPSVSSAFDIQYRSYIRSELDTDGRGIPIDNGTVPYTKGTYQPLSTQVLSDSYMAVEGLIIDMKHGGIGFRRHTAPPPRTYGSSWSEDLLFTTPETVCVDTNLTLDFRIPITNGEVAAVGFGAQVFGLNLTDRGGFVNLNHTYPTLEREDTQKNPELWMRAYKAAWLNNALSMAFMNVTNIYNATTSLRAFSYLNSTMNKTFPLHYPSGKSVNTMMSIRPSSLQVATSFGGYLDNADVGRSNLSIIGNQTTQHSFPSEPPLYANPFNISISLGGKGRFYNNFSNAELVCAGSGGDDLANITNMVGRCGLLYGTPRRQDGSASLLFEPGSAWTLPMYSCMSVVKASIKTVSFRFNGTNDLSGLAVVSIDDKKYSNEDLKPLWAVENSNMPLKHGSPLWGIVTPEVSKQLNISTLRKESLYLPGFTGVVSGSMTSHQNLPGADFAAQALGATYETGKSSMNGQVDYSGQSNLAMYRLWQQYARTAPTSAKILNLIWTDLAANLVLGTRGLQPEAAAKHTRDETLFSELKTPRITSYTRRVKYKYAYGIPALLVLLLTIISALATAYFTILGHAKPSTMRAFLQHTSAGRFLTSQNLLTGHENHTSYEGYASPVGNLSNLSIPTKEWVNGHGRYEFTLSVGGWTKNVQLHGPGYDKAGTTASYTPVPTTNPY